MTEAVVYTGLLAFWLGFFAALVTIRLLWTQQPTKRGKPCHPSIS